MADLPERSGTARMRPRARLVSLIGEDLISDEPVAVVELVKNAYDADATRVAVHFDAVVPTELRVEDDGHGMDLDTVLSAWFEPGTIAKRKDDHSPGGRIYQGAKGIGRFASARLAKSLLLETCTDANQDGVTVLFDWGVFDLGYLDEIEIAWELTTIADLTVGTRLTLAELRKHWTDEDFEELHSRMSRLISPFDDMRDFRIDLQIPGHPQWSGDVQPPELLAEPRYLLKGELSAEGMFTGEIAYEGQVVETITSKKLGPVKDTPACGAFSVEIRAWDRDREGLDPLAERLNMGVTEIRRLLNTYSGVSIYRDGFRVYPYGQRGNDWLKLDNRSRQNPVKRLANNQIVGAVRISREANPGLRDRSTREGMVLNSEHAALENWFIEVLAQLEEYRYGVRPREKDSNRRDEPLFEPFDISGAVKEARHSLGADHPVAELMSRLENQVSDGVERIQDVFSRLLMSAGLGQMVDLVIHEIGAPLGKINRQVVLLEKAVKDSKDPDLADTVVPMLVKIKGWLEQIHSLRQRLDPQTAGRRGRATRFTVQDELEDTFNLYEALLQSQGIEHEIQAPSEPIKVRMARAALGQVLANLVDNSIYWLGRTTEGGKIVARLENRDDGFAVIINDSGPGVEPADQAEIFEPYFTRKPNGIGLGLYIARLVIEPYGRLLYRDDGELPGACFEAIFERSVGL